EPQPAVSPGKAVGPGRSASAAAILAAAGSDSSPRALPLRQGGPWRGRQAVGAGAPALPQAGSARVRRLQAHDPVGQGARVRAAGRRVLGGSGARFRLDQDLGVPGRVLRLLLPWSDEFLARLV